MWKIICSILLIGCGSASLLAQNFQPLASQENWRVFETEHFDVYYTGDKGGAAQAARYAERVRYELGVFFDFKPEQHFTLLYAEHPHVWLSSNLTFDEADEEPGLFPLPKRYGMVLHPGTQKGLYQAVRKAVAEMMLVEFSFGTQIGTTLQTQLLLNNHRWFQEGLLAYVSEGWSVEDEQLLAGVNNRELVNLALEGNARLHQVVRKSIWYYITHEYGEQKISEIVYLVNISHSIESGIISVLGITLNTLTTRWRTFFEKRLRRRGQDRAIVADINGIETIDPPKGYDIIGMSYHGESDQFAVLLNKSGSQTVMLFERGSHTWLPTHLKAGVLRTDVLALDLGAPVKWQPDGKAIFVPIWQKEGYMIGQYDLESNEWTFSPIPDEISRVFSLSWSHDGQQLLAGVLSEGRRDIFLVDASFNRWEALTSDPYDNIDPVFSLDDQEVIFASNRDTIAVEPSQKHWQRYTYHFDLFRAPLGDQNKAYVRVTNTPNIDEHSPMALTSFEVLFASNATGINNLEKMNVFLGDRTYLTNFERGFAAYESHEDHLYLTQADGSLKVLYGLKLSDLPRLADVNPTMLRLEYESSFFAREQKFAPKLNPTPEPIPVEEPTVEDPPTTEPSTPTKTEEEPKREVRYYIFDEEEPYEVRKPQLIPSSTTSSSQSLKAPTIFGDEPLPRLSEVEIGESRTAPTTWRANYLGLGLRYDPLSRLGLKLDAGFEDLTGDQSLKFSWAPYLLARNHMFTAEYAYKKGRIDYTATAGLTTRRIRINDNSSGFERDSLIFQYNKYFISGAASYPLSSFASVSANLGVYYIDRVDQRLTRSFLLEDRDVLASAGVRIDFDNVVEEDGYQIKGMKAFVAYDYYHSALKGGTAFQRIQLEGRHYQPLVNRIVLATRFGAAFNAPRSLEQYYLGGIPDRLFQPISLPQDEGIRVQSIDTSLQAIQFIDFVQPVRGFVPSVRQGSRYVVFNAELRIPLTRLMKYSLPGKRLYNIELIPFLDAGTVWVDGNPFSQKKPTDTQIIPSGNILVTLQTLKSPFLFGFGSGLRARVLGWTIRTDLAWGVDDYSIQPPLLTTSFGKNF